jgi:hypothetical protein
MAAMRKGKCTCNLGWWIVALVVATFGVWAVAAGFIAQFNAGAAPSLATAQAVAPWYFGGLLLIGISKMVKWKSHGVCPMHGKMA